MKVVQCNVSKAARQHRGFTWSVKIGRRNLWVCRSLVLAWRSYWRLSRQGMHVQGIAQENYIASHSDLASTSSADPEAAYSSTRLCAAS